MLGITTQSTQLPKAVIFDMDGVIIDSEPLWRLAEIETFKTVGLKLTNDDCSKTMGWHTAEVVTYWHDLKPWEGVSKKELATQLVKRVAELIEEFGKPMRGLVEALRSCETHNLPIAVASSSPMVLINAVTEAMGIKERFQILQSADEAQFGKPHPEVFLLAAKKLGINPLHCLVIEDSFHGMIAANAARMKVAVVPAAHERGQLRFSAADYQWNSLLELDDLLNSNF